MKNEPKFEYDKELGLATCTLTDRNTGKEFVGVAQCHLDDLDMCSEKTGCEIALHRVSIEVYKYMRDVIKAELSALNQLYYSINRSKKFNSRAYETIMLYRQINLKEDELETAKALLENERTVLREYLNAKEKLYNQIRSRREAMAAAGQE